MPEQQLSVAGDPVYRYNNADANHAAPAEYHEENIAAISHHIEKHVGEIAGVFHEIVSEQVHIDIHWVKPTEQFPFHTLVTSGMSDRPMHVPEGLEDYQYTELCILLPASWPITIDNEQMSKVFKEEKNYWPVRWLKIVARFPHEYNTWLGHGHTVPNGNTANPFAANTELGCMLLLPSLHLGNAFSSLPVNKNKTIRFYCLYPLYREEMDLKLEKGLDALIEKFKKQAVSDVVDINRRNTCVKNGLLHWLKK